MKRPDHKFIAGFDLHGNNVVIGVIDLEGKRVTHGKVECNLQQVEDFLKPYKSRLKSSAVESTFNWYWLVDGLRARGYPVELANPARIAQYSGTKHADDKHDAFHLAELQRLKILPTAHVYDPVLRPVRDLFRRRTKLVQQRTAWMLSFKSLYSRTTGSEMSLSRLKSLDSKEAPKLYEHPANQLVAQVQLQQIESLNLGWQRLRKRCWVAPGRFRSTRGC